MCHQIFQTVYEDRLKSSWPSPYMAFIQFKLLFYYVDILVAKVRVNKKCEFGRQIVCVIQLCKVSVCVFLTKWVDLNSILSSNSLF